MDSTMSLSDIAAVTKDNDGMFGGNGGMWIFALLILLLIGNGGLFGGNSALSQADLQRAVDLNSIQEGQAGINSNVQRVAYENMAAIKDAQLTNLQEIRDNGSLISAGNANIINSLTALQSNMQTCCCETQRNVDSVRFDMANYNNAIQNAIHEDGEKTRAMIYQNKVDALQSQVNQLQISQAVCGIPKVSTYAWGTYPYNGVPFPTPNNI